MLSNAEADGISEDGELNVSVSSVHGAMLHRSFSLSTGFRQWLSEH